jgi:hypothetical protein
LRDCLPFRPFIVFFDFFDFIVFFDFFDFFDLRTDRLLPPRMINGVQADPTPPLNVVSGLVPAHVGTDAE